MAEDGLLVQPVTIGGSQIPGSQLDWLVSLSPCKLLLPYLYSSRQTSQHWMCVCALWTGRLPNATQRGEQSVIMI